MGSRLDFLDQPLARDMPFSEGEGEGGSKGNAMPTINRETKNKLKYMNNVKLKTQGSDLQVQQVTAAVISARHSMADSERFRL
jgi:hypothetical protein